METENPSRRINYERARHVRKIEYSAEENENEFLHVKIHNHLHTSALFDYLLSVFVSSARRQRSTINHHQFLSQFTDSTLHSVQCPACSQILLCMLLHVGDLAPSHQMRGFLFVSADPVYILVLSCVLRIARGCVRIEQQCRQVTA
jgi:hypothetical protein